MKSQLLSRRRFLAASGSVLAAVPLTAAERAPEARVTNELVDCQGHLFFSSDHPWVQPKEILDPLRSLNLPAATPPPPRRRFSAATHVNSSGYGSFDLARC